MESEELVDTFADPLGEAEAETLCHTPGDVKAVTLVETLAYKPAKAEAGKLCDTLGVVKTGRLSRHLDMS